MKSRLPSMSNGSLITMTIAVNALVQREEGIIESLGRGGRSERQGVFRSRRPSFHRCATSGFDKSRPRRAAQLRFARDGEAVAPPSMLRVGGDLTSMACHTGSLSRCQLGLPEVRSAYPGGCGTHACRV